MPAIRIQEFDTWRPGYANSVVRVLAAGTDSLATIYLEEALTNQADNPQTLLSRQDGDTLYGKFQAPLYTNQAYTLDIDSTDETGTVRPPLTTLDGQDASLATARSADGAVDVTFEDILARVVNVADFGEFLLSSNPDASATTNAASLASAISAVSDGGFVEIPEGIYEFTTVSLPPNVILRGKGRDVSILLSTVAAEVVTAGGDGCGCRDLTLDGSSLQAGSVGFYSKAKNGTVLDRVTIKRFGIGLYTQGSHGGLWTDLVTNGCTVNEQLHGDTNGDATGSTFTDNIRTGICKLSVTIGIDLEYKDAIVAHNRISVGFEDNAVVALKVRGARYTDLGGSWWTGNDVDMDVDDFVTGTFKDDNTIAGLWVRNFRIDGGSIALKGQLQDVVFERGSLSGTAITLTLPGQAVVARDVVEDAAVTIAGDGTKWLRWTTTDDGASEGLTTNGTATKSWSIELDPGQRCILEGKVIGNARTSDESGEYWIGVSARRPPSTLDYDTQTANFATGLILTGASSGATARIVTDTDAGATGTLELRDIVGAFVDNEIITDSATGSATANGTLTEVDAELLGSVTSIRAAREDDAAWDAVFVANGPEIELQVTGAGGKTVEWLVRVAVVQT